MLTLLLQLPLASAAALPMVKKATDDKAQDHIEAASVGVGGLGAVSAKTMMP